MKNALRYKWSNGQLEGQVNRLKLIKRQMYGRAMFDLAKGVYRARELARDPLPMDKLRFSNPREEAATRLLSAIFNPTLRARCSRTW